MTPDDFAHLDLTHARPDLEAAVRGAKTWTELEQALGAIQALTPTVFDKALFARKLFMPGLDSLVPFVAEMLKIGAAPPPKSNANVCILATQFYATGGHTRVARDIGAGLGEQKPFLILTNTFNNSLRYRPLVRESRFADDYNARGVLITTAAGIVERILELHQALTITNPSRIVLICHPYDVVAFVAAWPFRDIVDFIHHCDHIPSLGAGLPWSTHADVTYTAHLACRSAGLDAVYCSMTSPVVEATPHRPQPGRLRLMTCGDQRKFEGEARFGWSDYATAALKLADAEILHIGPATEAFQAQVHGALAEAGLDPGRYVFAGRVDSLGRALIDHEVDLYLASYPNAGGKSALEAMLAGVPVIQPWDDSIPPLMRFSLPLPHYLEIHAPAELAEAVPRALDLGEVMRSPEGKAARDQEIGRFADFLALRPLAPAV